MGQKIVLQGAQTTELIIRGNSIKLVDNSLPSPIAQNTKLCSPGNQGEQLITLVLSKREAILNEDKILWYIIDLLINSGCRVSEILSITPNDILLNGTVKINALKGGKNRIISSSDGRDYLINCRAIGKYPFMDYNRYYVYRAFKKWGISYVVKGNTNTAVTHAFRHANTELQRASNIEKEIIQSQLGHTSKSTQEHYGCNKKGKC
jgi:integrase